MQVKVVVAVVAFCIALTSLIMANMVVTMMIGEINRKRGRNDLVSYFGFTPSKTQQIFGEYRELYPQGRLHKYAMIAFGIAGICFLAIAALMALTTQRL